MRAAVLAIALLMGGTALAQNTTTNGTAGNTGSGDMATTTQQPTTGQTTGDQSTTGQTMGDQSTTGTNMTVQTNAPASTTSSDQTQTGWNNTSSQTTLAANTASTGAVVQPSNANPRRDARGVRVISAPAMVPGGYNGTQSTGMGGPMVDPNTGQAVSDTGSARACTRTVTDHCLQTYERHRAR